MLVIPLPFLLHIPNMIECRRILSKGELIENLQKYDKDKDLKHNIDE